MLIFHPKCMVCSLQGKGTMVIEMYFFACFVYPDIRNNFLRLCVLKVTQQSEKHLEKILNVDEFVKRVFSVIHSNDPVARAITLR